MRSATPCLVVACSLLATTAAQQAPSAPALSGLRAPQPPPTAGPQVGDADECSAPELVVGQGFFNFDLTNATTGSEGQTNPVCYSFGSTSIENDVWFEWVSPLNGWGDLSTCTGAPGIDTKVAIYDGSGCPVDLALACSDDDCGTTQSYASFEAFEGATYLLQVGNSPGAAPGSGQFHIAVGQPVGSDECSTPDPLWGQGTFTYYGGTTGTEGQNEPLCMEQGSTGLDEDVWYDWLAPASGIATISTCGLFALDTKIAVYEGAGCPTSPALGCNDNGCQFEQSRFDFAVTEGNHYAIQIGGSPGDGLLFGNFEITITPTGGTGADVCANATPIIGEGLYDFDNTNATLGTVGQGSPVCNFDGTTAMDHDVWFQWTNTQGGIVTISTCGLTSVDTKMALWPTLPNGNCISPQGVKDCNDDDCGLQSTLRAHVPPGVYKLQLGTFPGTDGGTGSFTITLDPKIGTNYCTPQVPNSTGQPSRLHASGSRDVSDLSTNLSSFNLPPNQTAMMLASQTQTFVAAPGCCTVGNLCVGGDFARFTNQVQDTGPEGEFLMSVDLNNVLTNPPQPILAGQTWSFQLWHRDSGGTANFTQGVQIPFQ